MATQGPWKFFNRSKLKVLDTTVSLKNDTFKIVLCASSQSLDETFLGTSTDCRYADLTGELATANGYTASGQTLTSNTLTRTTTSVANDTVAWDTADAVWTITGGGLTFKYALVYSNTATNKDLVAMCDMDTGGGSVSPLAGALTIGIVNIETFK